MVCCIPINLDKGNEAKKVYSIDVKKMSHKQLIKEFIGYLDVTDETDSGTVFHPITISCCRVMLGEALGIVLEEMKRRTNAL